MAMGGAWSNDQLRDLVLPPSFPPGSPHRVIGPDIPAVLVNFSPDYTWEFVDLWYYDATQFYFEALVINHVFGLAEWITGTYITANGVQLIEFVDGPGGTPNSVHWGTDNYDTKRLQMDWRTADLTVTSTATLTVDPAAAFISGGIRQNVGAGVAETWHALAFSSGWSSFGGGFVAGQYRKIPAPYNSVEIIGTCNTGTTTGGTVIATLPAGYRPATQQRNCVYGFGSSFNITNESPSLDVNTSGQISVVGVSLALATVCAFHFFISLDA